MASYTLEDMKRIASTYGGKCLSKEYVDNQTPLQWMCKQGHTWDRAYGVIQQQGIWCSQCMANEAKLEPLKELAEKKGGECLSENYLNCYTKLTWRCAEGHTFLMTSTLAKQGTWCQKCRRKKEQQAELERLKKLAQKKGGDCLSDTYVNQFSRLKFQCKNGHTWTVLAATFSKGGWCDQCEREKITTKELERLNKLAHKKEGKCLSPVYVNTYTKLKWECKRGHVWSMDSKKFQGGQWCKKCRTIDSDHKTKTKFLNKLKTYVAEKGGEVISEINSKYKVRIKCEQGHTWFADPRIVLHRNSWCQKCLFDSKKTPFETLRKIVEDRGGTMLSKTYINSRSNLKIRCENGHTFETIGARISIGRWCVECQYAPKQGHLEKYRQIAKKHKGRLISTEYKGINKPLEFQCAKGHNWKTVAKNVADGRWCPVCAGKKPK